MRLAVATALALRIAIAFAGTATAGAITAGDLIVIDNANGTLDDINPTTGKGSVIASGFSDPQGLAINALGTIFVSDILTHTIRHTAATLPRPPNRQNEFTISPFFPPDWVILVPTRWKLRQATRLVNQTLAELHIEQHPDKTFIGRIRRGLRPPGLYIHACGTRSRTAGSRAVRRTSVPAL